MQEKETKEVSLNVDTIRENIYIIRGQKVMLDRDLAMLYGVTTKVLNQSVKRNIRRFPEDFMFQLTKEEVEICSRSQIVILNDEDEVDDGESLRSQFVTSNNTAINKTNLKSQIVTSSNRGGRQYNPYVFTEHGIAMLSSVLNSDRAIQVNIQIIRVFTKLREMIDAYKDLREKIEEMEISNEANFTEIFRIIKLLITEKEKPKGPMGFIADR
jgi:uncharacterized protein (UPF0147 family)